MYLFAGILIVNWDLGLLLMITFNPLVPDVHQQVKAESCRFI